MTAASKSALVTSTAGAKRLRRALYTAALPASLRWNPQLIALYSRLRAAGKEHKRALIACARKLLIFINTVVARGTPWQAKPPSAATIGASPAS
ncbi:transposase [Bradyrhizobium sp. RDI18]|uniref:transposase n=1 Tax=Bradyrhizobium sp. RDI18 TaxID=3367400 RepID=UPI00371FE0CB